MPWDIYLRINFIFLSTRFTECISCEHILGNRVNTQGSKKCEGPAKCIHTIPQQLLLTTLPFCKVALTFIRAGLMFERISQYTSYIIFRFNFVALSVGNFYKLCIHFFVVPLHCLLRLASSFLSTYGFLRKRCERVIILTWCALLSWITPATRTISALKICLPGL